MTFSNSTPSLTGVYMVTAAPTSAPYTSCNDTSPECGRFKSLGGCEGDLEFALKSCCASCKLGHLRTGGLKLVAPISSVKIGQLMLGLV